MLLQHFSELRDISWQEISSLNRIFNFGSMQRYADKEPHWGLHGKEGPAQILVYLSCCHYKFSRTIPFLGERGMGKRRKACWLFENLLFFPPKLLFWTSDGLWEMMCLCFVSLFPSVLASHCYAYWPWCRISTGRAR